MWSARYERLGTLERANFFIEVGEFVDAVFLHSQGFAQERSMLGADREQDVIDAVVHCNYSSIDPMNRDEYKGILSLSRKKEELRREIITDFLDRGYQLGLREEEIIVVRGFLRMAPILDDIGEKWRDDVIWSPVGRAMNALPDKTKVRLPEILGKLGLAHSYGILKENDNANFSKLLEGDPSSGYHEICQTEAYADQYHQLRDIMQEVVHRLEKYHGSLTALTYTNYFRVWMDFCDCTTLDDIDKIAEDLDKQWRLLPESLLITNPMEYGYYGPDGIRKDVITRMDMRDPRKVALVEACNRQKEAVYEYLRTHPNAKDTPILLSKLRSLEKTIVVALTSVTRTMVYDFNIAGESLPNSDHQGVADKLGKRILVFSEGCAISWLKRLDTWKRVYGSTRFADLLTGLTPDDWVFYNLATHETGETVSRDAATDARLGAKLATRLNENKSDMAGLAYLGERARNGELSEEEMVKIAKLEIASLLYYLSGRGNLQLEPYYNGGVITAHLAIETGLLRREGDLWIPDLTHAKDFLSAIPEFFWTRQAPVWESRSPEEARDRQTALLQPYLEEDEPIRQILSVASPQYRKSQTA